MTKSQRRKYGKRINATGELGEIIAQDLLPSAVPANPGQAGYDFISLNNKRIEVKCSVFSTKKQGWSFHLSYMQVMNADLVLLIALNEFGNRYCHWLIPLDQIPGKHLQIGDLNLNDFEQWRIE